MTKNELFLRGEVDSLRAERGRAMARLRQEAGWPYEAIGRLFGVTRERARQIIKKHQTQKTESA